MAVHGLVARVGNEELRLVAGFGCRVLPSVAMLQLEVGVALQFADGDAQAVVLTKVAIAATTGTVLNEQALVVLLGDDVHHAGNGIRAVEGRCRSLHDFNLLDVVRIDERQVVLTAHVAVNALAVNQNKDIGIVQSVELHLRAHVVLAECKRCCQA